MSSNHKNNQIAAVILAAGASTRMGTPKQLLRWQGQSLLRSITKSAIAADCGPIILVLGAYNHQIRDEVSDLPVQVVDNAEWQTGMGSSIRQGIQALLNCNPAVEAAILLLCDQPHVSQQTIQQLQSIYRLTHRVIVASAYQNTIGVPALFQAKVFPELMGLDQLAGAKTVIQRYRDMLVTLDFPQGVIDIDTPQDYQRLMRNGP